jgi:hypothetical protein
MQSGSATTAEWIIDVAGEIFEAFPGDIALLTGISLPRSPADRQQVVLDLVAITPTATVVGIDGLRVVPEPVHPHRAGRRIVQLQKDAGLQPPLPVYVCWLGIAGNDAVPGAGEVPTLSQTAHIQGYLLRASGQEERSNSQRARDLFELLLRSDARSQEQPHQERSRSRPFGSLRAVVGAGLAQVLPIGRREDNFILPADVNRHLRQAMLDKENHLEDVNYGKIVPNSYTVEVNEENYRRNYAPIEQQVRAQWRERLLSALNTANSRQGRRTYRFGGSVQVEIRPASNLAEDEVRVHPRIESRARSEPDAAAARPTTLPCLEQLGGGRRWPMRGDLITIGRSAQNDIHLDDPQVQQQRLVSSRHAYIRQQNGRFLLFDGSPDGKASLNGTFVNDREVGQRGVELQDGDVVVLAALDPRRPQTDTPGVAALVFHRSC